MDNFRSKLLALAGKIRHHHAQPATPEGHQAFIDFASKLEQIALEVEQMANNFQEDQPQAQRQRSQGRPQGENHQRRRAG